MWWKWLGVMVCGVSTNIDAAPVCEASSGTQQMPVIELFTSEGCSSCPPADAWLARQDPNKAILLAWHVDYWNYLGWDDPLSQPAFSQRQIQQAGRFGAQVYTPQFMLNGEPQQPGSTPRPVRRPAGMALRLQAQPTATGWRARLDAVGNAGSELQYKAVLVGASERHAVRGGENAGRTLLHSHPVLAYWQIARLGEDFSIARPQAGTPLRLVAWAERRQTVAQAVMLPLSQCGR